MIKIQFFTLLRLLIKKHHVHIPWEKGETVRSALLKTREKTGVDFLFKLMDGAGELKTGTIILVNGRNVFHLNKLDTPLKDNDILDLFPPGGGG